jgi:mannose/cellobiose epimerase-like protein (N-acyl-D-glucosamine 2-epimerase family)
MPVIAASSLATVDGNNKRNWTSTYKAISLRQSHLEKDLSGWLAKLTTSQLPVRKNGSQQATLLLDLVESDQKHLQDDSRCVINVHVMH